MRREMAEPRDEHAQMDPNKWGLVGGSVEPHESDPDAARRELAEETGISQALVPLGNYVLPCSLEGQEGHFAVFTARTSATDADVECTEGRQIVFIAPGDTDLRCAYCRGSLD